MDRFGRLGNGFSRFYQITKQAGRGLNRRKGFKMKITKINTTDGIRFVAVGGYQSRTFKTENGAKRWAEKNGRKYDGVIDLTKGI